MTAVAAGPAPGERHLGPFGGGWQLLAECAGAPPDLFCSPGDGDDEPAYPPRAALAYCGRCPVRPECLTDALATSPGDDWGVRGGTSRYQRRQLRRGTSRRTCLGCASEDVVVEGGHELCLGCGLSWFAG